MGQKDKMKRNFSAIPDLQTNCISILIEKCAKAKRKLSC